MHGSEADPPAWPSHVEAVMIAFACHAAEQESAVTDIAEGFAKEGD